MLVLACADAIGAVVGKRWGRHSYEVIPGQHRTLEGSAAFALVAFTCVLVPLLGSGAPVGRTLVVAVLLAVLTTALEGMSTHGFDNLLVPLGTLLYLDRFERLDMTGLAVHAALIVLTLAVTTLLRFRRDATGGAVLAFALASYTITVMGGLAWVVPLAALVVTFAAFDRLTPGLDRRASSRFELGTPLIGLAIPVGLVLVSAAFEPGSTPARVAYVAYLAALACQVAVLLFLLPQHQTFRFPRIRRVLTSSEPWRHEPTLGLLTLAAIGAYTVLGAAIAAVMLSTDRAVMPLDVLLVATCSTLGFLVFLTLASGSCARQQCAMCGGELMHGLSCCAGFPSTPRSRPDASALAAPAAGTRILSFRTTYLAANSMAALAAGVVATWIS